jgi:U3 small nucleolar RNA-associated protein 15
MPPFKKLRVKQYPQLDERDTAEARFWKRFGSSREEQHPTPAVCIHFNPVSPRIFAVTSSIRVSIYDALSNKVQKTFARFKDVAYSGQFRCVCLALCDSMHIVSIV